MKNILVVLTGGTIVSTDSGNGLEPNSDNFIKKYTDKWECNVDFICPFNLDSSQITPRRWIEIGKIIDRNRKKYSGVLVTHGTDTLAYTSTALSLMFENIDIPVVVTGSQIPLNVVNSDAPSNLELSREILLESQLKGVFVAFGQRIMYGHRCSKTFSEELVAFESINCEDVSIDKVFETTGQYKFNDNFQSEKTFLLKAFPGLDGRILQELYQIGYKHFVIEAYGKGSLPNDFVSEVERVIRLGGRVGIVTQCRYNGSECYRYKAGRDIVTVGAFDYGKHTTEYAVVHMMLGN